MYYNFLPHMIRHEKYYNIFLSLGYHAEKINA